MLKICVNSQTPLIRFKAGVKELAKKYRKLPDIIPLSSLKEGKDYDFTPGGVTRMVYPLLKQMLSKGIIANPHWVALNPIGPNRVTLNGITLHHVALKAEKMKGYGYIKEIIWNAVHGIHQELSSALSLIWKDEYSDYTHYNRLCSELILRLDAEHDFDLFYIHDFQQLPAGFMLHTLKPKIFRWHIPFDETTISPEWRQFLSSYLKSYDAVVVSCRKYLKALKKFGYEGRARYIYPYIDPRMYKQPSKEQIREFCHKFGISESDKVVLVVARLDPMKGQDRAIKAIAHVTREIPEVKLILVGNGSFSSSKQGLALNKASKWLSELLKLAKNLKIEDKVIFTGHLTHRELEAAYARCDLTVLPSIREGFGLVVIESWLYKKPTIVSSNAGIAELIIDGENGLIFNPSDPLDLASKICELFLDSERALEFGERGFEASKKCHIDEGVKSESELLIKIVEGEGED
jgi:glycosyltransferase involved in cell wall biosynthesis